MKFLELPVKFNTASEEEMRKFESMEMDLPESYIEDGYLWVNPDQIVSFNRDSTGQVNLVMSNSAAHMIYMDFDEFYKIVTNDV